MNVPVCVRRIIITILVGLSACVLLGTLRAAERDMVIFERRGYSRVDVWVRSSACAAKTRAFFVVCEGDRLIPVEEISGADDRGHTLAADLWAMAARRGIRRAELVRLNWAVNVLGLLGLAAGLFLVGLPRTALAGVALLTAYAIPERTSSPDVTAALPGILGLSLVPAFGYLLLERRRVNGLAARATVVVLSVAALLAAYMLRSALGAVGLIVFVATVAACAGIQRQTPGRLGVLLIVLMCLVPAVPGFFLRVRDSLFAVPRAWTVGSHGFSHSLYIGLGFYPNPWGIQYKDSSGADTVRRIDPAVRYCSPEYFAILRGQYLAILRESPREVLRIYGRKLAEVLRLPLGRTPLPYGLALAVMAGTAVAWLLLTRFRQAVDPVPFGILALGWLGVVAQGVLVAPDYFQVYPAEVLQVLMSIAWLDWAQVFSASSTRKSPGTLP